MVARLFIVLLALAFATPAHAGTTLIASDGSERPEPYQSWVDASRVPTPDARIALHLAPCPFNPARSCANPQGWIFLYTEHAEGTWKWAFLHELGHHFDYNHMTNGARLRFRRIIAERRAWRSSPNSPHEQFAEAWSQCARSDRWLFGYESRYAESPEYAYRYRPTLEQHRRVCALVRAVAR